MIEVLFWIIDTLNNHEQMYWTMMQHKVYIYNLLFEYRWINVHVSRWVCVIQYINTTVGGTYLVFVILNKSQETNTNKG